MHSVLLLVFSVFFFSASFAEVQTYSPGKFHRRDQDEIFLRSGKKIEGKIAQIPPLPFRFGAISLSPDLLVSASVQEGGLIEWVTVDGMIYVSPCPDAFMTLEGGRELPLSNIDRIAFCSGGSPVLGQGKTFHQVYLKSGERVSGVLGASGIEVTNGWEDKSLKAEEVVELTFDGGVYGTLDKGAEMERLNFCFLQSTTLEICLIGGVQAVIPWELIDRVVRTRSLIRDVLEEKITFMDPFEGVRPNREMLAISDSEEMCRFVKNMGCALEEERFLALASDQTLKKTRKTLSQIESEYLESQSREKKLNEEMSRLQLAYQAVQERLNEREREIDAEWSAQGQKEEIQISLEGSLQELQQDLAMERERREQVEESYLVLQRAHSALAEREKKREQIVSKYRENQDWFQEEPASQATEQDRQQLERVRESQLQGEADRLRFAYWEVRDLLTQKELEIDAIQDVRLREKRDREETRKQFKELKRAFLQETEWREEAEENYSILKEEHSALIEGEKERKQVLGQLQEELLQLQEERIAWLTQIESDRSQNLFKEKEFEEKLSRLRAEKNKLEIVLREREEELKSLRHARQKEEIGKKWRSDQNREKKKASLLAFESQTKGGEGGALLASQERQLALKKQRGKEAVSVSASEKELRPLEKRIFQRDIALFKGELKCVRSHLEIASYRQAQNREISKCTDPLSFQRSIIPQIEKAYAAFVRGVKFVRRDLPLVKIFPRRPVTAYKQVNLEEIQFFTQGELRHFAECCCKDQLDWERYF